jgi:hypothetical protein
MHLTNPGYHLLMALTLFTAVSVSHAAPKELNISDSKNVIKNVVTHGMMGASTQTLVFYTLNNAKAVLTLRVDGQDPSFPVHSRLFLFADGVDSEGLGKWVNNQHSDGLFPEVPEPAKIIDLPVGTAVVTSKKPAGESKQHNGTFEKYEVTITVLPPDLGEDYSLAGFSETVPVFVKQ